MYINIQSCNKKIKKKSPVIIWGITNRKKFTKSNFPFYFSSKTFYINLSTSIFKISNNWRSFF